MLLEPARPCKILGAPDGMGTRSDEMSPRFTFGSILSAREANYRTFADSLGLDRKLSERSAGGNQLLEPLRLGPHSCPSLATRRVRILRPRASLVRSL